MPRIRRTEFVLALPLACMTTIAFATDPPAVPPAEEKVDVKAVTDDDALELDVLAVVSLPLAADDAREAGIPAEELADVVDAVSSVGASPAVATQLLVAETEQVRKHGVKPNFSSFIRSQLAEGAQSEAMLAAIEKREAEYIALSPSERQALDRKLAGLREQATADRNEEWIRIDRVLKTGKKLRVAGAEKLGELRTRVEQSVARQKRIEAAIASDPAKRAALERAIAKVEKAMDTASKAIEKAKDAEPSGEASK